MKKETTLTDKFFKIEDDKLLIRDSKALFNALLISVLIVLIPLLLNYLSGAFDSPKNLNLVYRNAFRNIRAFWIFFLSFAAAVPLLSLFWGVPAGISFASVISVLFTVLLLFGLNTAANTNGISGQEIMMESMGVLGGILACIGIFRIANRVGTGKLNLNGYLASQWDHLQDLTAEKNVLNQKSKEIDERKKTTSSLIEKINVLIDSSSDFSKELDLYKASQGIARHAFEILGRGRVMIYKYTESSSTLLYAEPAIHDPSEAGGEDYNQIVRRRRENLLISDVSMNFQIAPQEKSKRNFSSLMIVSLMTGYDMWGVIRVESERKGEFSRDDLAAISMLAVPATLALNNADLYSMLEKRAITDGMTGLYRRHYFEKKIEVEFSRARRAAKQLSLLFFDLDHFKTVNDNFGHAAGDEVLKGVSALLLKEAVPPQLAARYGGEEFVMLLPDVSKKRAVEKAEEIRRKVSELFFNCIKSSVTVSIGAASFPDDSATVKQLIEQADNAVYLSKKNGRNRVTAL